MEEGTGDTGAMQKQCSSMQESQHAPGVEIGEGHETQPFRLLQVYQQLKKK